jgi:putative membrane protein
MMGYGWGWSGGMGFGMLFMVFCIFVIAGIAWLVLALSRSQRVRAGGGDSSALRILEERLARGELDTEEFRTRRAAIEESKR